MQLSLMTRLLPLKVLYTLGFPRISRRFWATSFPPALGIGIRKTWLARNSSEAMEATRGAPVSVSRRLSRTSAVGTRRMCCWGGRHWARMGLFEKALRNGFRGCIHSTGFATALSGEDVVEGVATIGQSPRMQDHATGSPPGPRQHKDRF